MRGTLAAKGLELFDLLLLLMDTSCLVLLRFNWNTVVAFGNFEMIWLTCNSALVCYQMMRRSCTDSVILPHHREHHLVGNKCPLRVCLRRLYHLRIGCFVIISLLLPTIRR